MTVGMLRKVTDFFLEEDEFTAEDGSGGCLAGQRGGRPGGRGLSVTTWESENTGLRRSTETESTF